MHKDIYVNDFETEPSKKTAPVHESFGDRLCKLRNSRGITQSALSFKLHLSRNAVSNWEAGRALPDSSKIIALCDALQVSPSVLLGYEEEDNRRTVEDRELLFGFHKLDQKNQLIVRQMVQMLNTMQDNEDNLIRLDDLRRVYLNSERASAGTGNMLSDSNGEYIYLHLPQNRFGRVDEVIAVTGDSMQPTFQHGDQLLVEHTTQLNEGEIGIFIVDGQGYVKEYQKDGLHSHNPAYDTIRFNENSDVRCVGRVVDVLKDEQYASQEEIDLMEERKGTRRPRRRH